jgi:hypothetical protein
MGREPKQQIGRAVPTREALAIGLIRRPAEVSFYPVGGDELMD